MSFWDVVWFIMITFAFMAYLMLLFYILTDLFRDHHVSGWAKAGWVVALVFLPFLTALVYLVARGHGMAERSAEAAAQARQQQEAYIKQVAGAAPDGSPADQIAKAQALLDQHTISQEEFDRLKRKALA